MEHLLLVNRRRAHKRHRRARTHRRRVANRRRRMPPALAAYWANKRRGHKRRRLSNPRRRRRHNRSHTMSRRRRRRRLANPRHRRVHHQRRHTNRRHRRHYRRLRNPRRSGGGGRVSIRNVVHEAIIPAAIGGAGALSLDVVMGYLNSYLPASLQATTGSFNALNTLVKLAGALGIGMVASRFLGASRGRVVMIGAMTVTVYSAIRTLTAGSGIPGLSGYSDYTPYPMGRLGYISPGAVISPTMAPRLGAYMRTAGSPARPMGAYMPMNVAPSIDDGM